VNEGEEENFRRQQAAPVDEVLRYAMKARVTWGQGGGNQSDGREKKKQGFRLGGMGWEGDAHIKGHREKCLRGKHLITTKRCNPLQANAIKIEGKTQ